MFNQQLSTNHFNLQPPMVFFTAMSGASPGLRKKIAFQITCLTVLSVMLTFFGCTVAPRYTKKTEKEAPPPEKKVSPEKIRKTHGKYFQVGMASYYAHKFHGRKTANGEIFNMNEMTAAHPTLPFNTMVRVTNLSNRVSVVVRINDRGPFAKKRIIDLSRAAAKKLGIIQSGVGKVGLEILKK